MDLRHLRLFVAVAEEGHITRAAEKLGMQQPPLSQQIKAMERELDVQLFHRKPRGVELTEAGRALFAEARAVLAHVERALETTHRTARGEQGRLCIGIAPTALFHPPVPRAIRDFREAFPQVSLTLEEGLSYEVVERLCDDRMDVAFVRNVAIDVEGIVVIRLLDEPLVAALPSHHGAIRAKREPALSLESLANHPFVLTGPPGTGLYDETVGCVPGGRVQPSHRATGSPDNINARPVAAGLGVALVPESLQSMKMDGVVYRRLKVAHQPKAFLGLASRKGDRSPVLRHFLAHVRKAVK